MAATITPGYAFGSTEQVTNTKLASLASGTISGLDDSSSAAGFGVTVKGTGTPTNLNDIWIDTNISPPVVKKYDGTNWTPLSGFQYLQNNSGGSLAAGDVVVVDTANSGSVTTTTSVGNTACPMVAMQTIANTAFGVFAGPGAFVTNLNVNGAVTRGQFLKTHSVAKQAVATSTADAGVFAIALAPLASSGSLAQAIMIGGVGGTTPTAANALTGSVVQVVNAVTNASATTSVAIPWDDTIPQITEGAEFLTKAITPFSATNLLRIDVSMADWVSNSNATIAVFQDATANALAATQISQSTSLGTNHSFHFWMVAGTTSSTTFRVRAGASSAAAFYINGDNGGRKYGGVAITQLTITEYKV